MKSATWLVALAGGWWIAAAANAELGGPVTTVMTDGARMGATSSSASLGSYMRHDLVRPNSATVHEFTNDSGQVFAVTWQGPGKPDLRLLLGASFPALQASTGAGRALHSLRRPPQVNAPDLQIQTGGHLGWFHGVAFIPSLAPAGFAPTDLKSGS